MSRALTQTLTKESRFPWNDQWQTAVETALAAWASKIPATCSAHGEPTERQITWEPHNDYRSPPGYRDVLLTCRFEPCLVCMVARAGFPPLHQRCSFENFTADTDELQANLAKAREFAADPKGFLLMLGRVGTGKTHLAASIVRAVGRGRYFRHLDLVNRLRASYARPGRESDPEELPEDIAEACRNASLLVIDELGVATGGNDGDVLLHDILDHRVGDYRPTVLCANIPAGEMAGHVGDRLADRFRQAHFAVLNFTGPSRRRDGNDAYLEAAQRHRQASARGR
jgi:DNA replication protein DnaC